MTDSPEPRRAQLFPIPAGTKPAKCSRCPAWGYWILTAKGKNMLVEIRLPDGTQPTPLADGLGTSHFITCPAADQFRRKKKQ